MKSNQAKIGSFYLNHSFNGDFRLLSFLDVFTQSSYFKLQNSFRFLPWKKKETNFYKQYEALICPKNNCAISSLYKKKFFYGFKKKLEIALGKSIRNQIRIVAHKLITADEIGVHTDYCDPSLGYENYRFIFQFANPDQQNCGGEICFLNSNSKQDIIKRYPHISNGGVCL